MTNTGLASNREVVEEFATGYHRTLRGMKRATPVRQLYYSSAGMYSTVGDLFKYDRALHDGKLLSKESTDLMDTSHYDRQGYAWTLREVRGNNGATIRIANHHGSQPGFTARIWSYLDQEHCIILMDNHESRVNSWSGICNSLAQVLEGSAVPSPNVPAVRPYLEMIAREGLDAAVDRYRTTAKDGTLPETSDFDFEFEFTFHFMPGYLQEALEISSLWTQVRPESSRAWVLRADALRAAERYDEAKHSYSQALALDSDSAQAQSGLKALAEMPI